MQTPVYPRFLPGTLVQWHDDDRAYEGRIIDSGLCRPKGPVSNECFAIVQVELGGKGRVYIWEDNLAIIG